MVNYMKWKLFILSVGLLVLNGCQSSSAETLTQDYTPSTTDLISVTEAYHRIQEEEVIVFGVYNPLKALIPFSTESSPIADSYQIWRDDYSGTGNEDAISTAVSGFRDTEEDMEVLLSKAGVTQESTIFVYSAGAMHDAARFYWQLKILGLEDVKLLDGGLDAWQEANLPTGKAISLEGEKEQDSFTVTQGDISPYSADIYQVLFALEHPEDWVVIDTRSTEEYQGEKTSSSSGAYGTGAIEGTIHINWSSAVEDDQTLKSEEELAEIYGDIIEGKKVITFCQSGVRSSHTEFVLKQVLGVEEVYNYDGSWIEWSYVASDAGEDIPSELKESVLDWTRDWTDNNKEI